MSFEEIAHTADRAIRVRAADVPELFAESACGMNMLSGAQVGPGPATHRTVVLSAPDGESLLVAFLSELVYAAEQENLLFTDFQVNMIEDLDSWELKVEMSGGPINSIEKAIKAVTYHNLQIRKIEGGVEVEIVFDV